MKNGKFAVLISLLSLGISCKQIDTKQIEKGNPRDVFTKVFNTDNLDSQTFTIDNNIDNLVTGQDGTELRINKGIFVDEKGNKIKGKVEIKLIEALDPEDMVLGNLTTTFNGKPLETGGMLFIGATSNGKDIFISNGNSIQVKMPTDSKLTGMSLFEGVKDSTKIEWANPEKLKEVQNKRKVISFEQSTNVTYSVDGFDKASIPAVVMNEVGRIAWAGDGLKISKDSVFTVEGYVVRLYKNDTLNTFKQEYEVEQGTNTFIEDQNTSYIFSIKKLGWANIDRLINDPRTKEVELITNIENQSDFDLVYVSLLTQRMYIPGYQKKDETFGFSHGDEEKQRLPVGENAIILATAYKNGTPFYGMKEITIAEKQDVSFKLTETTKEKLMAYVKGII